jgi:hypothetical protein
VEAARKLAERVLVEADGGDDRRIEFLWRQALSRAPDSAERALVQGLLDRRRADYRADPGAAKDLLAVGIAPRAAALDPAELAAWAATARAVLNLHETFARY